MSVFLSIRLKSVSLIRLYETLAAWAASTCLFGPIARTNLPLKHLTFLNRIKLITGFGKRGGGVGELGELGRKFGEQKHSRTQKKMVAYKLFNCP